jgi:predicted ester cyclase
MIRRRPRTILPSVEQTKREDAMSTISEDNKAAVRACFEAASKGNFDAFESILTRDYVLHPEGIRGAGGLAEMVSVYRSAISDLHVDVEHQFTDGDYVATRVTVRGTHDGDLMGTAPTGRKVAFSMLTISRCQNGRIAEEWEIADTMALLQQVGAAPEPVAG